MKKLLTEWRQFLEEQEQRYSSQAFGAEPIADDEVEKMTGDVHFPLGFSMSTGRSPSAYNDMWDEMDWLADYFGLGSGNMISKKLRQAKARIKLNDTKINPRLKQLYSSRMAMIEKYKNSSDKEKKKFDDWATTRKRK